MEIKMNKEIRDYAETMFFGLSLRQFLFSALGCLLSVGIFFCMTGMSQFLGESPKGRICRRTR